MDADAGENGDENAGENATTLRAYERGVEAYLAAAASTSSGSRPAHLRFLERVRASVPDGARVLEVGAGPGTDADWFERSGLEVRRSDAARSFVERLRSQGHEAHVLDVLRDPLDGPYDLLFANAVLLHLTVEQFDGVLRRVRIPAVAMSLKEGDGAGWSTAKLDRPRWFTYWRESDLRAHLAASGWTVEWLLRVEGRAEPWLQLMVRRRPAGPAGS